MADPEEPVEPDLDLATNKELSAEKPVEKPESTDNKTDAAVDDIVRTEGDDVLKAQDEKAAGEAVVMRLSFWERFKNVQGNWWGNPAKRWGTISGAAFVIAVLAVLPLTRYAILGLFVREDATVQALDSESGAPVSGALVRFGSVAGETNAEGKAMLRVRPGKEQLQVSKKYYAAASQTVTVTLSSKQLFRARLKALGRQVKVKVVNKISGQPVANAMITAVGANAKTNSSGFANLVLPSGSTQAQASVSAQGYNTAKVTVDASGNLARNTFSTTPSGKLYFLSNLNGTIDVVKTDLDGTNRQTVLAGTGSEDPNSTSLLASRDWKYLALLSKRSSDTASLYLIDTTNGDKLTTIDQGGATFSPLGWSGDRFIYEVDRHATISDWQSDQQALKSFDPATGHALLLDQTQASGTGSQDWVGQNFGQVYLLGDRVVYAKGWGSSPADASQLNSKQVELDSIGADGSGHQTVKTFTMSNDIQTNYIQIGARLYEPNGLYIEWSQVDGGPQFYGYESGKLTQNNSMTDAQFGSASYPTYLLSPSSNSTFWADQRDGKNTLFTGDQDGKSPKQIATLSDYSAYGWFTDNYLLVSRNSSELYIMPVGGGTPLKITDYYKPPVNYNGYGGGYGGL